MKIKFNLIAILSFLGSTSLYSQTPIFEGNDCQSCSYKADKDQLVCYCLEEGGGERYTVRGNNCLVYKQVWKNGNEVFECNNGKFWDALKNGNYEFVESVIKPLSSKGVLKNATSQIRKDVNPKIRDKVENLLKSKGL